ncbi:MAG TPA: glycerate-2-kinase family protein, partial [Polyangia bacterium]
MNVAAPARRPLARLLASVYADATAACDGARLVRAALENPGPSAALAQARSVHVLALGKVALPMLEGLRDALSDAQIPPASGLIITSAVLSAGAALPPTYALVTGEHPVPGAGSLAAGHAARNYVAALSPDAPLVVLLSGGGSALACLPAGSLTLADKVATVTALAKSGASIHELNAVRKHLSAIKGGRLGARARGPVLVLALSDVTDDDLSVIASGPFHSDPTTFADALSILGDRRISVPAAVREHLEAGAAGRVPETVKPSAQLEIAHH